MICNYRGIIADSDDLPLPAEDNIIHLRLLELYWAYNRERGSYRRWFQGGALFAPNQRYAFALAQTLRRLEREDSIADEETETETSSTPSQGVLQ
jgi:hypothetical protein